MGLFTSKPEFITVLADKQVKIREDIILRCKANTEEITACWEKNNQELVCVHGKHIVNKTGTAFELKIQNADEGDEGKYTIHLNNRSGSNSCSAMVSIELDEWRTVQWSQAEMIKTLKTFKMSNAQVREFRFLLYGPIGAGKSNVINTINTIFEGRIRVDCPTSTAETESSKSHTLKYEKYVIGHAKDGLLSLAFSDTMGVEQGEQNGVHSDDIINALKGHIKEGYMFNSKPLTEDNLYYLRNPGVNDKIHCLVNVIPADRLSMIKDDFLRKMKVVREGASSMGILQVVLMTRVDLACPLTNRNLRNVYKSKKIQKKIRECSLLLGVPENCIFPVCNYHRETSIDQDINCLMLDALTWIVRWTDDYMVKHLNKQKSTKD